MKNRVGRTILRLSWAVPLGVDEAFNSEDLVLGLTKKLGKWV